MEKWRSLLVFRHSVIVFLLHLPLLFCCGAACADAVVCHCYASNYGGYYNVDGRQREAPYQDGSRHGNPDVFHADLSPLGEGEDRQYASLGPGQLIESITLEDALKLFSLPRTVGQYNGIDIIATKGRFGPYLKYGDRNISLPRGTDPLRVDLEKCIGLIDAAENRPEKKVISEFRDSGIQIIAGNYGPYLKYAGNNYRIPKGTDAASLTEEDCKRLIEEGAPTGRGKRRSGSKTVSNKKQ